MRIVYVRSNPIDPDPRVEKQMSAAVEYGHTPIALAWNRRVDNFEVENSTLKLFNKDVQMYRFNIKADFGKGFSNIIPLLIWQIKLLRWLMKYRNSYELIHAYDFDTVLPALFMRIFFKKKYIYDICDFYIDAFNVPRKLKFLIKKMDFYAIKKSEAIILVNESRVEQIQGSTPKKTIFIHNSPPDNIIPCKIKKISKPTIFYAGVLADNRMIIETINICKRHPEWNFIIGGFGPIENYCDEISKKIENIHFLGKIPYEKVIFYTKEADVIFACYDPSVPNHKYSSPNKLYEAMLCMKPIIVCRNTGVDKIVEDENIGLICEYDERSLEGCYARLLSDPKACQEFGRRSRQVYEDKYSWLNMKKRLGNLYSQIAKGE